MFQVVLCSFLSRREELHLTDCGRKSEDLTLIAKKEAYDLTLEGPKPSDTSTVLGSPGNLRRAENFLKPHRKMRHG